MKEKTVISKVKETTPENKRELQSIRNLLFVPLQRVMRHSINVSYIERHHFSAIAMIAFSHFPPLLIRAAIPQTHR